RRHTRFSRDWSSDVCSSDLFVEASLAENDAGTRADPIIVRDGNRGRLIPAFQTQAQDDPKGQVAAEIIAWLFDGGSPAGPVFLRSEERRVGKACGAARSPDA